VVLLDDPSLTDGEVLGVVQGTISAGQNLGFAVPVEVVCSAGLLRCGT
jgi:hypothetical protein